MRWSALNDARLTLRVPYAYPPLAQPLSDAAFIFLRLVQITPTYSSMLAFLPDRGAITLPFSAPENPNAMPIVADDYHPLAPWRLDETSLIHAIRMVRSLLHGFVSLEAVGGFGIPVDLEESYAYALSVFLEGLDRTASSATVE